MSLLANRPAELVPLRPVGYSIRPELYIAPDQHGLITGATGSGKTFLAKVLLRPAPYVVIIDVKGTFQPEAGRPFSLVRRPDDLRRARHPWIVYRPEPEFLKRAQMERVLEWIYRRRRTRLYVDELGSMGRVWTDYPEWLKVLYLQGRELQVGVLAASQRPANIPGYASSEVDKIWKFFLLKREDQKRIADMAGTSVMEPKDFPLSRAHSDEHSFYYWDNTMRTGAREFVLRKVRRAA